MRTFFFFFQAEDGIRDAQESRGLGDVYKRQMPASYNFLTGKVGGVVVKQVTNLSPLSLNSGMALSLIHI